MLGESRLGEAVQVLSARVSSVRFFHALSSLARSSVCPYQTSEECLLCYLYACRSLCLLGLFVFYIYRWVSDCL